MVRGDGENEGWFLRPPGASGSGISTGVITLAEAQASDLENTVKKVSPSAAAGAIPIRYAQWLLKQAGVSNR